MASRVSLRELYWALLHSPIDVGMHLTAEERRSARMQQAREYEPLRPPGLASGTCCYPEGTGQHPVFYYFIADWYFARRWKNTV